MRNYDYNKLLDPKTFQYFAKDFIDMNKNRDFLKPNIDDTIKKIESKKDKKIEKVWDSFIQLLKTFFYFLGQIFL